MPGVIKLRGSWIAMVCVVVAGIQLFQTTARCVYAAQAADTTEFQRLGEEPDSVPDRSLESIQQAAPEHCVAYFSWSGWDDFDPQRSLTEKWLDQPEIQEAIETIRRELTSVLPKTDEATDQQRLASFLFQLSHHLAASPTGISIYELNLNETNNRPRLSVSLVADLGERLDDLKQAAQLFFEHPSAPSQETITVAGHRFQRVTLSGPLGELYFGVVGQRLALATDPAAATQLLEDMDTDRPSWLAELNGRYPLEHQTGLTRINLQSIQESLVARMDSEKKSIWLALGLDQATEWATVTGLEGRGTIQRGGLKLSGAPRGLFQLLEPENSIGFDQLMGIDPKSDQIHLLNLPVQELLPFIRKTTRQLGIEDPIEEPALQLRQDLGVDLEDLLGSLSGRFTIYGKLTMPFPARGWVVSVGVTDEDVFEEQFAKVVAFINGRSGWECTEEQREGKTYYRVSAGEAIYISRSSGEIVCSMNRRAITKYWKRKESVESSSAEEAVSREVELTQELDSLVQLIQAPELKDRKFIYAGSIDFRPYIQLAVPILSVMLQGKVPGTNLSMQDAPSAQVLTKYWEPSLFALYRSETGYDFYSCQTFPFLSPGPLAPTLLGWLIPLTQLTEESADN